MESTARFEGELWPVASVTGWHLLTTQVPPWQSCPQLPQFEGSPSRFTQLVPHGTSGAAQPPPAPPPLLLLAATLVDVELLTATLVDVELLTATLVAAPPPLLLPAATPVDVELPAATPVEVTPFVAVLVVPAPPVPGGFGPGSSSLRPPQLANAAAVASVRPRGSVKRG